MKEHIVSVCDKGTTDVPAHHVTVHDDESWSIAVPRPKGADAEYKAASLKFLVYIGFWRRLWLLLFGAGIAFRLTSTFDESVVLCDGWRS